MRWVKIRVTTNDRALEAVSAALEERGTGGTVFERGPSAIGYLPADDRLEGTLDSLRASFDAMPDLGIDPAPADITLTFEDDQDWANAWREHFKPLRVSERLTIVPSWETYEPAEGELIVRLDPGMAFGTGGHATTRLCMRALETMIHGGETVADIGTGSGVLAIAAALLGAAHVDAVDTDPVAVTVARNNVQQNGVGDRVTVDGGDRLIGLNGPYDVVIANILPNVVTILAPTAFERLKPGGVYLASGLTLPFEEDVVDAITNAGLVLDGRWEEDRWLALAARKPAA